MKTTEKAPSWTEYYTVDAAAECLPYEKFLPVDYTGDLYAKLWQLLNDAKNPTPSGGDGSGGTVETPDGRLGDYDDSLSAVWNQLTNAEQKALNHGYEKEHGFDYSAAIDAAYGVEL